MQRIDSAGGGRAQRHNDCADIPLLQCGLERRHVHAAILAGGHGAEGQAEDGADSAMGVVRLFRSNDTLAGSQLARDPECFQVGKGSAAGEMAQIFRPAKHAGDGANRFYFHARAGAAAVERVVVGIDRHGESVGGASQGWGGLSIWPAYRG